ncbi:MAG: hypothetical protein ABJQ29_03270 [Luteolibacter sp.]
MDTGHIRDEPITRGIIKITITIITIDTAIITTTIATILHRVVMMITEADRMGTTIGSIVVKPFWER